MELTCGFNNLLRIKCTTERMNSTRLSEQLTKSLTKASFYRAQTALGSSPKITSLRAYAKLLPHAYGKPIGRQKFLKMVVENFRQRKIYLIFDSKSKSAMNRPGPTGRFVSRFSEGYFSAPIKLTKFFFGTVLEPTF